MNKYAFAALSTLLMTAAAQAADPTPAPAPGSTGIYLGAPQLAEVMKANIAAGKEPALSQIANTEQYFINQVHRAKAAPAAEHPGWTELHIILNGSGTLVTGGTIKTTGTQKNIEGGVSHKVGKGDTILVPAGTAHQYTSIDGTLDAIEVRFIAPPAGQKP